MAWQLSLFAPDGTFVRDLTPNATNGFHAGRVFAGESFGTLDFTLVENGVYDLVLTVINTAGSQFPSAPAYAQRRIVLDSQLKVGQFGFSQQDIVIPVSGIPLTLIRTYNSLSTLHAPRSTDFGPGWTYAIHDVEMSIDEDREQTTDLFDETFSMRLGGGRNVTLTLPDGRRTTFVFSLGRIGVTSPHSTFEQSLRGQRLTRDRMVCAFLTGLPVPAP